MRRLCLLVVASVFAASCAGDSAQPLPTAPSPNAAPRFSPEFEQPRGLVGELTSPRDHDSDLAEIDFRELGAQTTAAFTLSGRVADKAVAAWAIANATVTISPGVPVTKTNSLGRYTAKLSARTYTIKVVASGYTTASVTKALKTTSTLDFALTAIKPSGATARCKDRTWSFSKTRSGTCSSHKGVQYWVCPGILCEPPPPPPGCGPRSAPCGAATAVCKDGTLSCSRNRSGTCSYHGGVACWICPGPLCY